jgi:hypothetical protein
MCNINSSEPRLLPGVVGALLFAGLSAGAPHAASASVQRPCSEPRVFERAAVNLFALPYRYVGGKETAELRRASRQIAALVHLEVLYSMLKYGDIGATDLVASPGGVCDVDDVIGRVTRGGSGAMRPGQTLVVVWGRLFEQGDQLYVQSYVRFLRQGPTGPLPETISVREDLPENKSRLELAAALPSQSVAFPPRRISKADLARVDVEFRKSMVVRPQPTLDAPGTSIDFAPETAYGYGVTEVKGDWMRIQPTTTGPAGWVRARLGEAPEQWSLQRWLPELAYVDAVNGFMRLRAGGGVKDANTRARISTAIDGGFASFEATVPADTAPAAYGLARAIRGFVLWEADGRAKAAALFEDVGAGMPDYAAARNLAAVTQPLRTDAVFDASSARRLGRRLVGALALDPADRIVLDNLDRLYRVYAERPEWSPFTATEIAQRQAVVQAASAKARAVPY